MKKALITVASTIAVLSLPVVAADMPGMKMDDIPMEGTPMAQEAQQTPTAKASGTVKTIDMQKGTLIIAHGAVPTLRWPPMTMGFKATPEQLGQVKAGDQVEFEFKAEGMAATIISIEAAQ